MTQRAAGPEAIAEIAVGLPVHGTFHYRLPPEMRAEAQIGVRVQVPFGRRNIVTGFIIDLPAQSPVEKLRDVLEIPDPEPAFGEAQLQFYRFIAHYYFAPLGEVIRTALPAGLFKSTRPVLALSEAGRRALNGPLIDPLHARILGQLTAGEELSEATLTARLGEDIRGQILHLLRWGFLEKRYRLAPLTAKRKIEPVWRLRPGIDLEDELAMVGRRSPKRAAVLQLLAAAGDWIGLPTINEQLPNARPTLNLLASAGLVEASSREVYRDVDLDVGCFAAQEVVLHAEQRVAVDRVAQPLRAGCYEAFCLHGVTGSGKTEVYMQLVSQCLAQNKAAIVLVPEIALTPQFLGRFICRLGECVAPYHSRLSDGERYDMWRKMKRGEARVVIGARSALFAPFDDLGLIIVDEEHESSFKQDDGVTYHARDLALKLGSLRQCPVVLGSATPSLETYHAVQVGRYRLLELTQRPTGAPMPRVEIVDMRREMERQKRRRRKKDEPPPPEPPRKQTSVHRVLSQALAEQLRVTMAAGEQAILFLNRRGFSTYAFCLECGRPLQCPLCDISLTFHEKQNLLRCHYCDYQAPPPGVCPHCAGVNLFYGGMGTERLESEVGELLPEARLLRLDRDTVKGKNDLVEILTGIARKEADILVGTQMVAKGHDFPAGTRVIVIDADAALMLPDFRAAERAFQLLSQVAGRAGRADKAGLVLLQSFQPEHYAIAAAARHDYPGFYRQEIARRTELHYPPTARLAVLRISAPNAKAGLTACRAVRQAVSRATDRADLPGVSTLGPAASLLHRLHGKHHWQLLIKAEKASDLHKLCSRLLIVLDEQKGISATFKLDIDPVTLL